MRKRAKSEKRAETVRERESRDGVKWVESLTRMFWKMVYEKFFRKLFSSFSFAFFPVKIKYFHVDFHFTSKQTSANAENIFQKTFYVETNED